MGPCVVFSASKTYFFPPTSMISNLSGSAGGTENVLCMKGVAVLKFYLTAISLSLKSFFISQPGSVSSHPGRYSVTAWQTILNKKATIGFFTSPRVFTLLKVSLPEGGTRAGEVSFCYCRYRDLISLYSVFQMQSPPRPLPPGYKVTSAKYIVFSSSPSANLTSSHQACRIDFWRK